jgi:hypothetical protein
VICSARPSDVDLRALGEQVQTTPRVATLLAERHKTDESCNIHTGQSGTGGALGTGCTELSYPAGDESLVPLRDQICLAVVY